MADNVVRCAQQFLLGKAGYFDEFRIGVFDIALKIRGRNQFLVFGELSALSHVEVSCRLRECTDMANG